MARENAINVEGIVTEALSNRTYRVALSNGHQVLAFFGRADRLKAAQLVAGEQVLLKMSPYDLSEGRIILEKKI